MIRAASRDDLPVIRELLRRSNHAPYDIATVAEEKCFGAGFAGPPALSVFVRDQQIAGVSVVCGQHLRLLAVDPAHRGHGVGSEMLRDAEQTGASVVAAEPGNYFTPGVVETDRVTIDFFRSRGYSDTAMTHNLEAPLSVGPATSPASAAGVGGATLMRAARADGLRILSFIEREFGRIWRFEAGRALDNDPPTLFYVVVEGEIGGFSAHEANNRGLASFGPTGVARSMRNRGLGRQLLHASLADLQRLGYVRAMIPWTDALDFYRKSCGAVPAHRFLTLSKSVVSSP